MRWPNITKFFLGMILMTFPIQGVAQVQAELEVNMNARLHTINPGIFGQFIEHYGRVIEHGVWAELLQNRKFYPFDAVGQNERRRALGGRSGRKECKLCDRSYSLDRWSLLTANCTVRLIQ